MKERARFGDSWTNATAPSWLRGVPWVMIGAGVAANLGFLQTLWASFAYGLIVSASMFFGVSRRISFLYACVLPAVLLCVYFTAKTAPDLRSTALYVFVWAKTMGPALIAAPLGGWLLGAGAHRLWTARAR
jgi:hypothetical protein